MEAPIQDSLHQLVILRWTEIWLLIACLVICLLTFIEQIQALHSLKSIVEILAIQKARAEIDMSTAKTNSETAKTNSETSATNADISKTNSNLPKARGY